MVSPPSPRGSVPIPSTATSTAAAARPDAGAKQRRGSRVLQSSLEIAFSYSRSQQRRYGHIRSAPSFVDVTSSPDDNDNEDDEVAGQGWYEDDDLEAHIDPEINQRRRSSGSPILFPSDPFAPRISPLAAGAGTGTGTGIGVGVGNDAQTPNLEPTSTYRPSPKGATERTPLLQTGAPRRVSNADPRYVDPKDRSQSLAFAPDGIGVTSPAVSPGTSGPAGLARRRSSGVKRRRVHHVGQSTNGQTLFNAIAVLVGIGLLSMPLAFAYAGWVGGTLLLVGFAYLTCHTAKLLARLILADRSLLGYTDIGRRAFGGWASGAINILFCLELFALSVALVVLFGDTLSVIFPAVSSNTFKLLGFLIVLPTTLLPLHLLSLPSLLSTISSLLLILILLIDGFIKTSPPGSILHPAPTNWAPEWTSGNWLGGVGLILAGFGGHAVVPGLARDMKHPECFERIINRAFIIATAIGFVAGAAGYLMIGNGVSDEITRDLLQPKYQYPRVLNLVALWMIVINPVTKFGLCTRPLNVTIETLLSITPSTPGDESQIFTSGISNSHSHSHSDADADAHTEDPAKSRLSPSPAIWQERRKVGYRIISRIITTAICALTAIALPGFGKVMAFLGSFSAFLICIILPLIFYIRLESPLLGRVDRGWKTVHWAVVLLSTGMMVAGTAWTAIPSSGHGGLDDGRV